MLTDIQISQAAQLRAINDIASSLGLAPDDLEAYGRYKAKIAPEAIRRFAGKKNGRLVLLTAITPTPAGEGKTTTAIGLADALTRRGHRAVLALREPSLGPVFGMKGGATGGGYAQVVPMEDINLHFTGDIHAITTANNLLCAMTDNSIYQGNPLDIDPQRVVFRRAMDMNDRALRNIEVGLGRETDGVPRPDGFLISVASEVMAALCLADGLADLKKRLGDILVAWTRGGDPVFCRDLKADGAMAALLKDAVKPNLVQTLEGTPCLMHGGPFANIAHGCNSVIATRLALKLGDWCITEAGFGSDLGGEKFLDIKCRAAGLHPAAVVLVATVRALKYHGGVPRERFGEEDVAALTAGLPNLAAHLDSLKKFGLPVVVAINRFPSDTQAEINVLTDYLSAQGVPCALSDVRARGGEGGEELAAAVEKAALAPDEGEIDFAYPLDAPVRDKIAAIVKRVYGGTGVTFDAAADEMIDRIEALGFGGLPVCMAKTQYSLSDDAKKLNRPQDFTVNIREVRLSAGAGFIVAITGKIMIMPGLSKVPAACGIDVDGNGVISGLF